MKNTRIVAATFVAGLLAVTTALGAHADPIGAPTPRQLNGSGSDTTQDVMNKLADTVLVGGVKVLGSWDATPAGSSITVSPTCTIVRPNGSGAGRNALADSIIKADGSAGTTCFQWSRSSSLNVTALGGSTQAIKDARQETYIPYAYDDLGFVVTGTTNIATSLSKADLQSIYNCTFDPALTAYIPQTSSGTRGAWLTYLGIPNTAAALAARPCIKDNVNGVLLEEHDGRALTNNSIMPYSVTKWLLQTTGAIADVHGNSILGAINGGLPAGPNPNFDGKRALYNVIPTSKEADPTYVSVFGTTGGICSAAGAAVIQASGFATNPNCGVIDPANRTANP